MKKPLPLLLLPLLLQTAAVARAGDAADDAAEKTAILRMMNTACEAFEVRDVAYLGKVLDDRFTLTDSRGVVTTKAQEIAAVRAGDPRYEVFRNSDMKVRLYGDTALVNGITTVKGVSAGQRFERRLQFTDTLVKRDGQWTLVASHASPLEH